MSTKIQKAIAAVAATALAASVVLGGTLAWQSINQEATNIVAETINPGGRLHDDFDGENKDIYVENFADVPIYARIQLREYLELGNDLPGTGDLFIPATAETFHDATAPGAVDTWAIHYFDETKNVTDNYVDFTWGGSTTYMPTFNMNKDSLEADINGTYEGLYTDGSEATNGTTLETDRYADHVDYSDPQYAVGSTGLAGTEIRDIDTNDIDEYATAGTGSVGTNWSETPETHYASTTRTATVISMADWQAMDPADQAVFYGWVYDVDGWAYWSQPIEPKEVDTTTGEVTSKNTTGLLLDAITPRIDDNFYYQIHVIAQFITANDLGHTDGTGFFEAGKGTEPSADALALLNAIGVDITGGTDLTITTADATAKRGGTVTFSAADATGAAITGATWLVNGSNVAATMSTGLQTVTAVENGTLTISKNETASTLTVIAIAEKSTTDNAGNVTATDTLIGSYEVRIVDNYAVTVTAADNATTVEVGDSLQFNAAVTQNGEEDTTSGVTWSVTELDGVSISDSGLLTIGYTLEQDTPITVTATSKADSSVSHSVTVTVENTLTDTQKTIATAAEGSKVAIEGTEYWVVVQDATEERALLWKATPVGSDTNGDNGTTMQFDDASPAWSGSEMQNYLNTTYLTSLPTELKKSIKPTTIKTASSYLRDVNTTYVETTDSVFLLTEADIFGVYNNGSGNQPATTADEYTYAEDPDNPEVIVTADMMEWGTGTQYAWLRSPRLNTNFVAAVGSDGSVDNGCYSLWYVRPAFWVSLDDVYTVTVTGDATTVAGGKTLQFNAAVTKNGEPDTTSGVDWTVTKLDGVSISDSGLLTVGYAVENDTSITVTATSKVDSSVSHTATVTVVNTLTETQKKIATTAEGSKVTIDSVEYWVVVQDAAEQRALLWKATPVGADANGDNGTPMKFDTDSAAWSGSEMQTYLNGTYLTSLYAELQEDIEPTKIKTADSYDRSGIYVETTDSVFLLSEADLFGNYTDADEYTYAEDPDNPKAIVTSDMRVWGTTAQWAWLRSLRIGAGYMAVFGSSDGVGWSDYWIESRYVRPAFWVNFAS